MSAAYRDANLLLIGGGELVVVISAALGWLLSRSIARPDSRIAGAGKVFKDSMISVATAAEQQLAVLGARTTQRLGRLTDVQEQVTTVADGRPEGEIRQNVPYGSEYPGRGQKGRAGVHPPPFLRFHTLSVVPRETRDCATSLI